MSVQEYIDKHDLSKKVEELINSTVKAKPDEPLSYMVRNRDSSGGVKQSASRPSVCIVAALAATRPVNVLLLPRIDLARPKALDTYRRQENLQPYALPLHRSPG